jgi:hypothetical protein
MKNLLASCLFLLAITTWLGATGCSSRESGVSGQQPAADRVQPKGQEPDSSGRHTATAASAEAAPESAGRDESWMACYINGTKIGYSHTVIEPVQDGQQAQIRASNEQELTIRRFQTKTVVRTQLTSWEMSDGQVIAFQSLLDAGGDPLRTEGQYEDGKLVMRTGSQGTVETTTIDFGPAIGGFFCDQQSLRRQPMKPRETRRLKALQPIVNQVGEIRLTAVGYEATELLSETEQLLRIEMAVDVGASQLKSTLWADKTGTVRKLRDGQIGMEAYLTSREEALTPGSGGEFDLGLQTVVPLERPIRNPHATQKIVYAAELAEGDIGRLLKSGGTQQVKLLDDRTAEVTVWSVRPETELPVPTAESDRPTAADRAATAMIQCQDPAVVEMADAVAADENNPWAIAVALEQHVHRSITLKNYTRAMATAAEVARSREGDCTEHAMLLAALCRAREIPARVAIGLVVYPAARGLAYHMWTEVWIADRWIPLDATLGRGGIGAAHLKFSHSSLQGGSAFAEMLPVMQAIGRLKLRVLAVE